MREHKNMMNPIAAHIVHTKSILLIEDLELGPLIKLELIHVNIQNHTLSAFA